MRRWIGLFLCLWAMGAIAQKPVELITYNIRMNTPADGEHAWPYRKADVEALFRFHGADIFCVQEALPEQMDDLDAACRRICSWVKLEDKPSGVIFHVFNTHFAYQRQTS